VSQGQPDVSFPEGLAAQGFREGFIHQQDKCIAENFRFWFREGPQR
jgi:hypothetical protein